MFSITELAADRSTVTVNYRSHEVTVAYRPSTYTTEFVVNQVGRQVAESLADLLDSWEVTGDDGEPLALTVENLRVLPFGLLSMIYNAVRNDAILGDLGEAQGNSAAG